ncbi:MAG: dihydrolipoamide acetyltransferase family protein [Robiginitomaculum sp.]
MAEFIFKMPDIGEGVTEAEIITWHVKIGDKVEEDVPICDAMTDKATVELTAPVAGTITKVGCDDGEVMAIGAALVVFDTDGQRPVQKETQEEPKPAPKKERAKPVSAPVSASVVTSSPSAKPLASPAVRKAAMDADIDLSLVPASGNAGNITHKDLKAYKKSGAASSSKGYVKRTGGTDIKITGMRRVISNRMSEAKRRIPHFTFVEQIDMTNLEDLRTHLNKTRSEHQSKLTLFPFFTRAIVKAAKLWPQCNATFDDDAGVVTQHNAVHLGMAAQTPNGLMVPVLRHAESLDVWQIARKISRLGEAAKTGSITASELSGSTITLTSLGKLAGVTATPVINRPEVGILCPNKIIEMPVVKNGQITVRKMMNFSSSFDHRVVDGFHAAEMIGYIKDCLEHPATLFLD